MKEELIKYIEELKHEHKLLSCEIEEKKSKNSALYLTILRLEEIVENN